MRKIVIWSTLVGILVISTFTLDTVRGQGAAPAASAPHKVGLIDMAYVFKEYKKFEAIREGIKQDLEGKQQQFQQMQKRLQGIQSELKLLKEGSPEYGAREKEFLREKGDYESFVKQTQRNFVKKESDLYKQIYLEVSDTVQQYAKYAKYTLVIRFNRSKINEADNPQDVLSSMNKQVVYYRGDDDITDQVLSYLNDRYSKSQPGTRQSQNPKRSTTR